MHKSSFDIVKNFACDYVNLDDVVVEVGSCDVNGNYKELFINSKYIGMDIVDGPNVDIVVHDPHNWSELLTSSIDVVICASVIEHVKFPWIIFKEIQRILKPNGCFCIVAPAVWEEHKYPIDCYRFYPDGMKALCEQAYLAVDVCDVTDAYDDEMLIGWKDCYCIGINPYNS
jgi:SAM-dependent methyltransferase